MTAVPSPAVLTQTPKASTTKPKRDRYLDSLRALAIFRVMVYHMFGLAWLSFAFPAMGVMFALGGSLMASSMRRSTVRALRGRVRRLLPALWVMGLIMVPGMLWQARNQDETLPFSPWELLLWIVPAAQPPGTEWAESATVVLWYITTYLWLVLLSPLAWWAYRRLPLLTLALPLLVLAALELGPVRFDGLVGTTVTNVATFGTCWILGFAHRSGQLQRLSWPVLGMLAGGCLALGAVWAVTHSESEHPDLNGIPLAQGVYSLGFVLVLMRWSPDLSWLRRVRVLDAAVTVLNSRAVTTYLWHNVAIAVCFSVGDLLLVWRLGSFAQLGYFGIAMVLVVGAVLALGWVEDVAARRSPRLLPATRQPD